MSYPLPEHDADPEILMFHDRMMAKGRVFYGIAVMPPKGKEEEVKSRLEAILATQGYERGMVSMGTHLVFEGELTPEAAEDVRAYLTSVENQTPSKPRIIRGDYFQMLGYKWLDGIVDRNKFNK